MRDVPSWHEYFMQLAKTTSIRSKDPNTQVGCVIVDTYNRVISLGYNGMPSGMIETASLWSRPTKYRWVKHAELNAIEHANKDLKGSSIYITMFPCENCAKLIISKQIKNLYYIDDKYYTEETNKYLIDNGVNVKKL